MNAIARRSLLFFGRGALFFLLGAGAVGCAYATPAVHLPGAIPAIAPQAIDLVEVTVIDGKNDIGPEVTADVRKQVTEILAKAARARGGAGAPARVRVHITLEERGDIYDAMRKDGIAVIGLLYAPFGLVIGREKLSVDVALETGGRAFTGHGTGDKMGSIYAPARRRALAAALDKALADASKARR